MTGVSKRRKLFNDLHYLMDGGRNGLLCRRAFCLLPVCTCNIELVLSGSQIMFTSKNWHQHVLMMLVASGKVGGCAIGKETLPPA